MGGRLSVPRGPDGTNELSRPTRPPHRSPINGRTLTAPLAAIVMAGLLFVYARTSIRAAKLNAQRHREADGGQIDWRNESRRRHGQEEKVKEGTITEALAEQIKGKKVEGTPAPGATADGIARDDEQSRALEEAKLRKRLGREG
ncbi:hypothetical protein NA57DRAFT_48399 [Rhizodiscina lignyota]|uniref:Uncharacterized protein n=1 Tax=Rhizodiscina lignyota TaxID=1504668 RepID=A0A9P4I6I8_9PEZI|nr:hypothetical protein NA57DRAFT_48399 [Rhizodiscina lignyota]